MQRRYPQSVLKVLSSIFLGVVIFSYETSPEYLQYCRGSSFPDLEKTPYQLTRKGQDVRTLHGVASPNYQAT